LNPEHAAYHSSAYTTEGCCKIEKLSTSSLVEHAVANIRLLSMTKRPDPIE